MPGDTPEAEVNRDPTKTSSSTQVVKLTVLQSQRSSDLATRPYSVLSYSIAFSKVKYQESRGGS